jgi:hypothetical protein
MGKTPRKSTPRADRTDQTILDLTEALLDEIFFDPGMEEAYKKAMRARRGKPKVIGEQDLDDESTVTVTVHPGSPDITVRFHHPGFQAEVTTAFDLDECTLRNARPVSLEGDRKLAGKRAKVWLKEATELGLDDTELTETLLRGLIGEAILDPTPDDDDDHDDDDAADPGAPPPPGPADVSLVRDMAARLTRQMKRSKPDMDAVSADLVLLEDRPQALWPILDGLVAACTASKRDTAAMEAWRFLFATQLTAIRYRIDRGWDWARRMAEECQERLIAIGNEGRVAPQDFGAILGAFGEARIEMTDDMKRALASAGLEMPENPDAGTLRHAMEALLEQMASAVSDPFDVIAGLGDMARTVPGEVRSFMAHAFALSPHAVLREAVPLLLLSEEQEVRRAAAAALEQTAIPESMSPVTLRRMIAIRNWIPHADRAALDQAIRKARLKGVPCAHWPNPTDLVIHATMIDGSGASSILVHSRGSGKGMIAGLLLKLATGVADSWCHFDAPRREINAMLAKMRAAAECSPVERGFLDQIVQHAIAAGVAAGQPPGVELLRIAELAGGSDWQDRRIDVATEAAALFDALPDDASVDASLRRSGTWLEDRDFADSWFLDDAQTRAVLAAARKRKDRDPAGRLLAEVMEERRTEWAERCLLHALRAQAATSPAAREMADDFVILAHELSGKRTLQEIPLMRAIADRTVILAPSRRS